MPAPPLVRALAATLALGFAGLACSGDADRAVATPRSKAPRGAGGAGSGDGLEVGASCPSSGAAKSYLGCDYFATVTSNGNLYGGFPFAIVVASPQASGAGKVTVSRGDDVIEEVNLASGGLEVIELPWVPELKGDASDGLGDTLASALVRDGAYHVRSTRPVTVYQFNPLEYALAEAPSDCPNASNTGGCFSFTNDASLLLPTTAVGTEYYVVSYPALRQAAKVDGDPTTYWLDFPAFLSITATADGTEVDVATTADLRAGDGVASIGAGDTAHFTLDAGDVLQLETATGPQETGPECVEVPQTSSSACPGKASRDLTGTHVVASKPVSVIAGHDCAYVPFDKPACDHLEEVLLPVDALGSDLVVTAPASVASIAAGTLAPDAMFVRVLSAAEKNAITFDPPVHPPVELGEGEWIEIGPVSQDFRVKAANKVLVAQLMVGENFSGDTTAAGDPSLSIAIPSEQYRTSYTFYAPATYDDNVVNLVAAQGTAVHLDGELLEPTEFAPIGGSGLGVARRVVAGGAHDVDASGKVGVVVYGYGAFTSYMYPGGMNVDRVVVSPN